MDETRIPRGIVAIDPNSVVVHFDGACEPPTGGGVAAYGYVVEGAGLYSEGRGLAVRPFSPRATNNVAEYVGAICALEWLSGQGYRGNVALTGDSQLVVRQMRGEYEVRAPHLRAYHDRLAQLVREFPHVEFVWVPREKNQRADALSKEALTEAREGLERYRSELPVEVPEEADPSDDPSARGEPDQFQRTV